MAEVKAPMGRLDNALYQEDLLLVRDRTNWSALDGAAITISGATGMIGTFLTDVLMSAARDKVWAGSVLALGRSEEKARARLPYFDDPRFRFQAIDISVPGQQPVAHSDVVFHLASTTHPRAYATQPIGTVTSNIIGLSNLLDHACLGEGDPARFVFASSVEVYGENRGDVERFDERYSGYIDCNTLRAGYPEAKRCGEALCQAYAAEKGVPIYVPRLPRTYGPTLLSTDTKALSQFLHRALAGEDIVLKSEGKQLYSYLYVADVVSGLLHVLTKGTPGEAYNLADEKSDITLRDLATLIASWAGTSVVFELPDAIERAGYSTATKAMLDGSKLQGTGWHAHYGIEEGLNRTLTVLSRLAEKEGDAS